MDLGANDYLTKPFAMDELMARIRAVLRRNNIPAQIEGHYKFRELELDAQAYQVFFTGQEGVTIELGNYSTLRN